MMNNEVDELFKYVALILSIVVLWLSYTMHGEFETTNGRIPRTESAKIAQSLIDECEKDLPRSKRCVIKFTTVVLDEVK